MAYPIIEQLAQEVVEEVTRLTVENAFSITLSGVVRESRAGIEPKHLLAVVYQDYEDDLTEEQANPVIITLPVIFTVAVMVMPDDTDTTPIDQLLNQVWADVTKAVTEHWNDGTSGIDTLAYSWSVLAPQLFGRDEGAFDGILCRYRALVRVAENDPYTQR